MIIFENILVMNFIFYQKKKDKGLKEIFKIIEQCETSLKRGTFNTIFSIVIMTEIFEACNTLEVFFLTKYGIP